MTTINHNRCDYLPSDLGKNVLIEVTKGATLGTVTPYENISQLTRRLSKRKPEWQIVFSSHFNQSNGTRTLGRAAIFHDGEYLGWYSYTYNYTRRQHAVCYDSPALNAVRVRGRQSETTDINKALKSIEKNFFKKPLGAVLAQKHTEAVYHMQSVAREKRAVVESINRSVEPGFVRFVWDNLDKFKGELEDTYNITARILEEAQGAKGEYLSVLEVRRAAVGNGGIVLVATDDAYLVATEKPTETPVRYTSDTLPDMYRAKLGMLKLIEPSQLVIGAGARISADTFVLLADKETNHDDRSAAQT